MTELQLMLLELNEQDTAMANAIRAGVFYAVATVISSNHVALPLTELADGTTFPQLFASEADAQDDLDDEVKARNQAIADGDLEADSDDEEDDFDLAVVEVLWDGGRIFHVSGREIELSKIQQGSC